MLVFRTKRRSVLWDLTKRIINKNKKYIHCARRPKLDSIKYK